MPGAGDSKRASLSYLEGMIVRTNSLMTTLLGGNSEFGGPGSGPVPEALLAQLKEGFKEVDGCVVPGSYEAASVLSERRPKTDNIDDETGFECRLSKVHLGDFAKKGIPLEELARMGGAYAMHLRNAIVDSQVSGSFRIIVDAQVTDAETGAGNTCSVRFHKVRASQIWLDEDLESNRENALWVFEFSGEKSPPRSEG